MMSPELEQLCVVLVNTRNPLNIGAAARAMSNFGVSDLRLVDPYAPSFREARSAVGAAKLLKSAKEYGNLGDAVSDCDLVVGTTAGRGRDPKLEMRVPAQGAAAIREHMQKGMVAILFGSEKRGLSNSDLSFCKWLMRIPTRESHSSMNLGQAVAICLYEVAKDRRKKMQKISRPVATSSQQERIIEFLFTALNKSGYVKAGSDGAAKERLRRLVRNIAPGPEDAEHLQGMLRQILWKLDEGK